MIPRLLIITDLRQHYCGDVRPINQVQWELDTSAVMCTGRLWLGSMQLCGEECDSEDERWEPRSEAELRVNAGGIPLQRFKWGANETWRLSAAAGSSSTPVREAAKKIDGIYMVKISRDFPVGARWKAPRLLVISWGFPDFITLLPPFYLKESVTVRLGVHLLLSRFDMMHL